MPEQSLKDKTAKGLLWGGLSNGMQQVLNLVFGIFLARLLTPHDYGMVGMLAIFTAIAGTLQESGFTAALANKKEVAHADYNAVFWFSFLMGLTFYIILFFSAPLIARYFGQPELVPLSRLVFLGFLMSSTATAHNAYLFKNLMVKQKAVSQVPALLISGTVGIIMAARGMSYWGIAIQSLLYIGIINLCFWHFSPWRPTLPVSFRPLKEMFGFSSKLLLTNIFLQINNNVFSAIIGRLFTPKEVGLYTQSNKWNNMGVSTVGGMVSSVAQPVLAQIADEKDRQQKVFRKMLRFTAYLSCPAMLGLALIAPEFIWIAIRDKWMQCVPMLQILCVWGAFSPIATLCSNLVISKGKSDIYMWNTIALCILLTGGIWLVHPWGIYAMITFYAVVNIGWLLVWHYFVRREIGLRLWHYIKDIAPFACSAAVSMCVAYYAVKALSNPYIILLLKIVIAAACYVGIMYIARSHIQQETIAYFVKLIKKRHD